MPIQVSWSNPQHSVIRAEYGEIWSLEDAHAMIDQMYELTTSVDHTVHSIMDFTHSHSSPAKLLSMGRHIENRKPANSGITVIVNASSFLKAMTQVSMRLFLKDMKVYFADSLEEAYQIIERHEKANVKS
jgi:hypothetical protein